jgi:hypothetical protein
MEPTSMPNHEELCAKAWRLLDRVDSDAVIADLLRAMTLVQLATIELLLEIRNELKRQRKDR